MTNKVNIKPYCSWCHNEKCVNDECPVRGDYCPVPDIPGICMYEERHGRWVIEGEEYRSMTVSCTSFDYVRHIYGWGLPSLKRDLKVNYLYCNKCGAKTDGGAKK